MGLSSQGGGERRPAEGAGEALPRQFGKYTLLRRLAAGGMAELFLALHRSVAGFEKLVVIKRILPSMNSDKAFIEMLLHEARIAATLSHPNIVQIFDVGQIEGKYFIAMEHIHGEDIRSIVRAMVKMGVAEFPLEHTLSIVLGLCAGLAYAHDKRDLEGERLNIVHRDISPQNILVTFTGDVKIVDFGIAKSAVQLGEDTKDGQLKGKIPYMSPEQASGQPIDWRSDIFAVGVLLFELTTGKRLFKAATEHETLRLIVERDYPRPSRVRAGYSPALERIVMKALAKRREDRYQSAREMQSDLEDVIREEQIPVSQVSLTRWMHSLFEEKLNQQKELLQDMKQLADSVAAEQAASEHTLTRAAGMSRSSRAFEEPRRRRPSGRWTAATAVVAALSAGGVFYLRLSRSPRGATFAPAEAAPASSPRPPEADAVRGSLDITSAPAGCAIWINGDLRKETTPATIDNLPTGRALEVKLTKDGLEPYREEITLREEQPSGRISAALKAGSVTVLLEVEPQPSSVWVDGKLWKGDRGKIDDLAAGEEHTVVMAASGYAKETVSFVAEPGATKIIKEQLVRLDPARSAGARPPPAAPAAAPDAKVRVGAKGGFCNVTVNGASVGPTPVEAPVRAGLVQITCQPAGAPPQRQAIRVGPGEIARVSFKLD